MAAYVPCLQIVWAFAPDPPGPVPDADQPAWAVRQDVWPATVRRWVRECSWMRAMDGEAVARTGLEGAGFTERAGALSVAGDRPCSTAAREGDTRSDREQSCYQKRNAGDRTSHGKGDHDVLSVNGGVRDVLAKQVSLNRSAYISFSEDTRDARSLLRLCSNVFPVAL